MPPASVCVCVCLSVPSKTSLLCVSVLYVPVEHLFTVIDNAFYLTFLGLLAYMKNILSLSTRSNRPDITALVDWA